jgi:hypothetical protein
MSAPGEAQPNRGPKGAAAGDLGRPTRRGMPYRGEHEEAEQ